MIGVLKKANRHVMYLLIGAAVTFSVLKDLLSVSVATAYLSGMPAATLIASVAVVSVLLFSLLARLLVTITFRICGAIFLRNNGMYSPFPIVFGEYESTALAFALPCFLLGGLLVLPALFLPTLSRVLDPLRTLTHWSFLAFGAAYAVKRFGHVYDRKSLAISLSVIPLVLVGISLLLLILEVAR